MDSAMRESDMINTSCAPTIAKKTVITNLDDGCLLEVFKHLALADLCAIADVCRQFRVNSRTHFSFLNFEEDGLRIEFSNGYGRMFPRARSEHALDNARVKYYDGDVLFHTVFRIFGDLIRSIIIKSDSTISGLKFAKSVLDGASLHCSRTLIELNLIECAIDAQIELAVRPLLSNLQTLSLNDSECGDSIGRMFSLCSSLCKLQFLHPRHRSETSSEVMRFDDILRQSFPKLELISFRDVSGVKNNDIDELLKRNPQLKKIEVLNCEDIDGTIFLSMARYTPHIDTVHIDAYAKIRKDKNLQYFGKLNSLSTLKLNQSDDRMRIVDREYMSSILCEIHRAKIPLQHLHITVQDNFKSFINTIKLVNAILQLKSLKTLWLIEVPSLTILTVRTLCKRLELLSELIVLLRCEDIVSIPSARAEYVETAEMIAQRQDNKQLILKVNCKYPFGMLPTSVQRIHNDTFKIERIDAYTIPFFYFL